MCRQIPCSESLSAVDVLMYEERCRFAFRQNKDSKGPVTAQPFDSIAFRCGDVWKRRITLEMKSAAGKGLAVPFRNLGISNGLRSCLKTKQCEEQLVSLRQSPHTA